LIGLISFYFRHPINCGSSGGC